MAHGVGDRMGVAGYVSCMPGSCTVGLKVVPPVVSSISKTRGAPVSGAASGGRQRGSISGSSAVREMDPRGV